MKLFLTLLFSILSVNMILGQQVQLDSGFTNKAEAKNLYKDSLKEGKWIEYYDNVGRLTTDTSAPYYHLAIYKDDKMNGKVRRYDKSGVLRIETTYVIGIIQGVSRIYDDNGILLSTAIFVNGKETGIHRDYYEDGEIRQEAGFVDGKLNGMFRMYYTGTKVEMEGFYSNDIMIGPFKSYYESGVLKELDSITVDYADNSAISGAEKFYYPTGTLKMEFTMLNNKLIGTKKEYYRNGQLNIETIFTDGNPGTPKHFKDTLKPYIIENSVTNNLPIEQAGFTNRNEAQNLIINNVREGKWIVGIDYNNNPISDTTGAPNYMLVYYKAGKAVGIAREYSNWNVLKMITLYSNGRRNGIEKEYDNGILYRERHYINDTLNGMLSSYFESGALKAEILYVNGKENGLFTCYYENGSLNVEMPYLNGAINGIMKTYSTNMKLLTEQTYHDGSPGPTKEFDENGNVR
ncbi:MAG TPA: toxin-antitoxin system YwqK family antitoxin [Bacteroidia bacterium]|jgi:antitoxin component YwqK of YwqJK toxin-antitoxin module|nr:toxin-antitoxin system YwqK family antitoxin [Bacteroidia bacterium]